MQHFIREYRSLAGMTATAELGGRRVPRSSSVCERSCFRRTATATVIDDDDAIFTHRAAKTAAIVARGPARARAPAGRCWSARRQVHESEQLGATLLAAGVGCEVLNAKHDEREAQIIARAGARGAVTISTNMAGRGTDIRLGGPARRHAVRAGEADIVAGVGGLYVIGTNRHESRRIDNQLRGRAGRQGDPGRRDSSSPSTTT